MLWPALGGMGQFVVPVGMTAGITRYRTGGPTLVEDAQRNPCFVIAEMDAPASPERRRSDQVLRKAVAS